MIRTRIAPSPTGFLHIGTARTALFNFLYTRHNKGKFVLRIEDTDLARSTKEYEQDILDGLKWLGIAWDEGPEVGGDFGPYTQMERVEIYSKYIDKLLQEKKAYLCYHTLEELEAERKELEAKKLPQIHTKDCRTMWKASLDEYAAEPRPPSLRSGVAGGGRKPAVRFISPDEGKLEFEDLIHGKIEIDLSLVGDFIIQKSDGTPTLHLAVVVDDGLMEIDTVIRGDDHLSNVPRQILLQKALGFPTPQYAHIPMILAPDRSKLSKRKGVTSISDYRKMGYLPEAIVNFIALLGWNPGTEQEIFSMVELIEKFDLSRVQKSGAIFNIEKLNFLNGHYLRAKSDDEYLELARPFFFLVQPEGSPWLNQKEFIDRVLLLLKDRVKILSELLELTSYFFEDKIKITAEILLGKVEKEKVQKALSSALETLSAIEDFTAQNLETELRALAEKLALKAGELFTPIRNAVSGRTETPPLFAMLEVLGKEKVVARLEKALKLL